MRRAAAAIASTVVALVLILNFELRSPALARTTTDEAASASPALVAPLATATPSFASDAGTDTEDGSVSSGSSGGTVATPAPSSDASTASITVDGPAISTRWGTVQVRAVIEGGRLVDVVALQLPDGDRRSREINTRAEPILRAAALEAQSANIDHVSGATVTWDGYTQSLQAALDAAGW